MSAFLALAARWRQSLVALAILGLAAFLLLAGSGSQASSTIFTVNASDDLDDGTCDATHCSLREAINSANVNAGTDTIAFNIPGAGPHTIQPASALPTITDPVIIDGYTQPGASPNTNGPSLGSNAVLKIELDGSMAGTGVDGLHITGGSSTVRGLVINRFSLSGIKVNTNGSNVIEGNFIGTDVAGNVALGNTEHGVAIDNIPDNIIGGTAVQARNVISGNTGFGVEMVGPGSTGNHVQGNLIGTDHTGTAARGNGLGVHIGGGSSNTVGGTTAEARNVISSNDLRGVLINGLVSTGNFVEGNFVGTDVTGTAELGNAADGVVIAQSSGNTIGGTTPGAGNVISGNDGEGVIIEGPLAGPGNAQHNLVQGNHIGTDLTDTALLGNFGSGVIIRFGASNNTVGAITSGAGNTIGFNGGDGVFVSSGTGNAIESNSILLNTGLGIDVAPDGVTVNDAGDGDTGANNLQNFPVLTLAASGSTLVEGTLNSTPNAELRIEFFSNGACDPSGHGEGETFVGSTNVTTDGGGNTTFSVILGATVSVGHFITATATDPNNNTSEFSRCITVSEAVTPIPTPTPTLTRTPCPGGKVPADGGCGTPTPTPTHTPTLTPTPTPCPEGKVPADGRCGTPTPTATPTSTRTPTPTPVIGMIEVDCDASAAGVQSDCTHGTGGTFSVQVHVTTPPEGGYLFFHVKLRWADAILDYLPTGDAQEEALWPECDLPARVDNQPDDPSVLFACLPLPGLSEGDTFTGPVLQIQFQCQEDGNTPLDLVPRLGDPQGGSFFAAFGLQTVDPILANATVTCAAPTPTPTPTNTPTPTHTPTPTPVPPTPIGGIGIFPEAPGGESSGLSAVVLTWLAGGVAAGALALGGAAWYARRRRAG